MITINLIHPPSPIPGQSYQFSSVQATQATLLPLLPLFFIIKSSGSTLYSSCNCRLIFSLSNPTNFSSSRKLNQEFPSGNFYYPYVLENLIPLGQNCYHSWDTMKNHQDLTSYSFHIMINIFILTIFLNLFTIFLSISTLYNYFPLAFRICTQPFTCF